MDQRLATRFSVALPLIHVYYVRRSAFFLLPLPPLLLLVARVALHEQGIRVELERGEEFGEERLRAAFLESERSRERRQHRAEVRVVGAAGGPPIPQPQVPTYDGRRALLDDILGEEFALVGNACEPARRPRRENPRRAPGARGAVRYPFGGLPQGDGVPRDGSVSALAEVEDLTGEGVAWFRSVGAKKGSVAIIRPDKFVYALTPATGAAAAVAQVLAALQGRRGDALEKQSVAAAFA